MNNKIFKKENARLANVNFSAGHRQVAMIGVIAIAAVALLFASVAIVESQQALGFHPLRWHECWYNGRIFVEPSNVKCPTSQIQ